MPGLHSPEIAPAHDDRRFAKNSTILPTGSDQITAAPAAALSTRLPRSSPREATSVSPAKQPASHPAKHPPSVVELGKVRGHAKLTRS
jgi:hypothetical protein